MKMRIRRRHEHFYEFGPFHADLARRLLFREGETVTLTSRAFDTLVVLLGRSRQIVDKDDLMKAVWPDTIVEENNLNQTISAVRKALGPGPDGKPYIETVPRRGYRFVVPVKDSRDNSSSSNVQKSGESSLAVEEEEAPGNREAHPDFELDATRIETRGTDRRLNECVPSLQNAMQMREPRPIRRGWVLVAGAGLLSIGLVLSITLAHHSSRLRSLEARIGIPPLTQGKYLVVLPFRVVGDEASLDYVAQGLAGALSARLFQLPELHVASAVEVERADKKGPLERTARQLGANLLIQGTLQGTAEKMRLLVSLEDVADGRRIWTGEFSGAPRDVVNLEDQIYLKVSSALGLEASNPERGPAAARSTENFEAYDLFLKGNDAMRRRENLKSVEAAIRFHQEALKKDPGFALAYAGLADASLEMYRQKKDSFWAERALVAAQQALRLDDNLAEAHFSLGSVYEATGKTTEAIAEEKRGLELAPNSDEGYRHLAHAFLDLGRREEALQAYQTAIQINPYYWFNFNALGYAYFQLGEFEKALNAFRRVTEMEPDNVYGYDNVGAVYIGQGKWSESIPQFERALQLQPDLVAYSNLGTAYFHLRRYDEAARMFEKAVEISPNEQLVLGNLADAYRWSGQSKQAMSTYDKAIAVAYQELQVNPRDAATMQSLALYYAKKGNQAQALEFIRRARSLDSNNVQFIYGEAEVRSLAGQTNEALNALRQALQKGYPAEEASVDPELNRLRNNPDFERLIETAKRNKT